MTKLKLGVSTLIGTIIGAGILGIPYVVAKAGIIAGLFDIIGIGLLMLLLNLYLGEVTLRTNGNHQLSGYAGLYLGRIGKKILSGAMVVEIYGALLAYIMGVGTSLATLFGGDYFFYGLGFFIIASFLIYKGLRTIGKTEFFMVMGGLSVVALISVLGFFQMDVSNFDLGKGEVFIPYGVVLFAYLGVTSVPLLKELLSQDRKEVKKAIIIGSVIPIVVYCLFALSVVGAIGIDGFQALQPDQRIASAALEIYFGGFMGFVAILFGLFSMSTACLALGMALEI